MQTRYSWKICSSWPVNRLESFTNVCIYSRDKKAPNFGTVKKKKKKRWTDRRSEVKGMRAV
jgi:hypothetical protein